jgi:bacterioferritin
MRANAKRIDTLNPALKSELSAINQSWLRYRILDNWGYKERAKTWREESIEEIRHADTLTACILFLEGYPNTQSINPLRMGRRTAEQAV